MEQLDTLSGHSSVASAGGQYLTFALGEEEYGVEILKVQEIKGYPVITPIPNTPPHVKGVMNLRGTIIPVVDLRMRLGMAEAQSTRCTVIVVVKVGSKTVGLVMDSVSDVLDIPKADIQATPDFGAAVDTGFISGMAKAGDRVIVLLDIDTVLRGEVFGVLSGRGPDE
ncbi:MAG TPA: chemotaxis protein CheW [Candidatus Rokubacteria bacterium]|nr:MAG: chemotaxis protein CheW [Candidatus Rokubacteria bacterium GWA2_73_35]HBH04925.1 chemotaxis protein CheW [Candidatus Rokubacteria bacterium]